MAFQRVAIMKFYFDPPPPWDVKGRRGLRSFKKEVKEYLEIRRRHEEDEWARKEWLRRFRKRVEEKKLEAKKGKE